MNDLRQCLDLLYATLNIVGEPFLSCSKTAEIALARVFTLVVMRLFVLRVLQLLVQNVLVMRQLLVVLHELPAHCQRLIDVRRAGDEIEKTK